MHPQPGWLPPLPTGAAIFLLSLLLRCLWFLRSGYWSYFCHVYTCDHNMQLLHRRISSTEVVPIMMPFKNWKVCYFNKFRTGNNGYLALIFLLLVSIHGNETYFSIQLPEQTYKNGNEITLLLKISNSFHHPWKTIQTASSVDLSKPTSCLNGSLLHWAFCCSLNMSSLFPSMTFATAIPAEPLSVCLL